MQGNYGLDICTCDTLPLLVVAKRGGRAAISCNAVHALLGALCLELQNYALPVPHELLRK